VNAATEDRGARQREVPRSAVSGNSLARVANGLGCGGTLPARVSNAVGKCRLQVAAVDDWLLLFLLLGKLGFLLGLGERVGILVAAHFLTTKLDVWI
jgi:hypothetical protein